MGSEMDTFAARLASFDIVLKPEKRRSSTTKGAKTIKWPHQSPSPAELAHAGFYYKPYESNPDNTTCFQCSRALDGWEEEDNPVTEHLKHSPDCAWAIIMDIQQRSSNPSTIEDPTSTRIAQARLDTFGTAWPHDGRRGWVCQSEKMVESGWYFCPTDESNDLASCAYCKLSLDGWEPKDDPFDEHHRRSPDCSFFVFAQPPGKKGKGAKSKKPRTSKASSRLSTQSVATTTSEAPEMDVDESMDQSVLSQATVKPKASKKGPKGKGKGTKSKKEKVESEDQMDVDNPELEQPEPELEPEPEPEPAKSKRRAGKGKKRVSDEITNDEPEPPTQGEPEPERSAEPPAKRRATRTRSSSVSQTYNYEQADHAMPDAPTEDEAPRKGAKRGRKPKKGTSTKNRKTSDISVSSQTTSRAQLPRDSELDASIKAGLESDVPQPVEPEPEPEPEQPRAAKNSKNSKKSKAVEKPELPLDDPVKDDDDREEPAEHQSVETNDVYMEEPEEPVPKAKATKSSKKKGTKKTKKEEVAKTDESAKEEDSETQHVANDPVDHENHESYVSVEIMNRQSEPRNEPEADPEDKPATKKSSKDEKAKKPKKTKKKEPSPPREPSPPPKEPSPPPKEPSPAPEPAMEEHDTQPQSADEDEFGTPEDMPDQVEMVEPPKMDSPIPEQTQEKTPRPPKTAKRYSDIPQEEHLAESLTESHRSSDRHEPGSTSRSSNRAVSPLPAAGQHTPSLSPQSSDAENRPPSRPSASRPTASSPSKDQKARTPLAASTPSPSKRNFNGGFAASTHPWTPIDIEAALLGDADDKENADLTALFNGAKNGLSSPEKKMTVEEWVMWNAKNGEERLKRECERLVGQFEKEGGRAMQRIEAIECID